MRTIKTFNKNAIQKENLIKIKGGTSNNTPKSSDKIHNKIVQLIMA